MRNTFFLFAMLLGLAAFLPAVSHAEDESALSITTGVDYASKYIWRGIEVNDEPVLQPSVTLGWGDWSFNVWANLDTTLADHKNPSGGGSHDDNVSEVDYTLTYAIAINDLFSATVGAIWYVFPRADGSWEQSDTGEVFATLTVNTLLSPTLAAYYDIHEVHGFYGSLAISHSFILTDDEKLALNLAADVAASDDKWTNFYVGVDDDVMFGTTASAGLSYAVTESLSVGGSVKYAYLLDSDVRDAVQAGGRGAENVWGVASIAYSF